jgi:hypothetical protein
MFAGAQKNYRIGGSWGRCKTTATVDGVAGGADQSVTQTKNPDIRVGDRVQIGNGVVRQY